MHLGLSLSLTGQARSGADPSAWVLRSGATLATLDVDFVNDRAWNAGALTTVGGLISCSRASSGYYTKGDGTLQNFTNNQLRYGTAGVLVELAATNLLLRSQEFDNAGVYIPVNSTVTANGAVAPDGTSTADVFVSSTDNAPHGRLQNLTFVAGTVYTLSLYAKYINWPRVAIRVNDGVDSLWSTFNVQTGAVLDAQAGVAAEIEALAGGWCRLVVHRTAAVGAGAGNIFIAFGNVDAYAGGAFVGAVSDQFAAWGLQVETGVKATSYIQTAGATATRATDVVTFSDLTWLDGANDTIIAEWAVRNVNDAKVWALDATNDKLLDEQTGMSARIAGATVANTVTAGLIVKAAVRLKANDFGISMNGGAVATDTSETAPGTLAAARLGLDLAGANPLNGYIRRVAAFKGLALNDAALQSLAAP